MSLTDTAVKNAKPTDRAYNLYDDKGLFLLIATSGGKLWRLKYQFQKKGRLMSLGAYPEVSLKEARERRDAVRKQVSGGIDPIADKKRQAVASTIAANNTFKAIAEEFVTKTESEKLAKATKIKNRWLASQLEPISQHFLRHDRDAIEQVEARLVSMTESSQANLFTTVPRPDDFLALARRGLYVFDWTDIHRGAQSIDKYELVASPISPTTTEMLPADLRLLAGATKLQALNFTSCKQVDPNRYTPCRSPTNHVR